MATIAFIPVRGGSKSIPLKNIKLFCGKPLIYWNLSALEETTAVDKVIVATDSDEIESTTMGFNFSKVSVYRRSAENAQDTSSTESVMLEYLSMSDINENDIFLLVQATSPLTQTKDFESALTQYHSSTLDSLLTCVRFKRFLWNTDGTSKNYDYKNRLRRQDFPGELMENGAFYINKVANIKRDKNRLSGKIGIHEMPEFTAIEIDEPDDWTIAESLMRKHCLHTSRFSSIKLFLTDIDGVLTDAGMYYSEAGDELKKFNTRDGQGLQSLRQKGIKTGIITSENTKIAERRAQKLKVDYLYQGKREGGKLEAAKEICKKEGLRLEEVAYIGDDVNCFDLLMSVGAAACPADAVDQIKNIPGIYQLSKNGGEGVVREWIDMILNEIGY